jgi:hypothetical protein
LGKRKQLEALGAEVVQAPIDPAKPGKTDLAAIAKALGDAASTRSPSRPARA